MFLRPRMTRTGGHAGPYVWGGVTGVTNSDNPWLTAVQENTATRLVVAGSSYDAEQRFLVNENPLSVRTALGVGLGSAGCAGPVFAPDKYGPVMWIDQKLTTVGEYARIYCTTPTITDGSTFVVEGVTSTQPTSLAAEVVWRAIGGGVDVYAQVFNGRLIYHDDVANTMAASNVQTLLGLADGELFAFRYVVAGTSLDIQVRKLDDVAWTDAVAGATVTATDINGTVFYLGHNSTGSVRRGKYQSLGIRDGGVGDGWATRFLPSMFVGGNRADGDTAVDAYGVTWTLERPAPTTDMPRVMVGGTEQYISLPGVSGEYVSTPDTVANSITGDLDIRVSAALADWSSAFQTLVSKWLSTGGQQSWIFRMTSAGNLQLVWSTTGSSVSTATSTAPVTFTDFATGFVRCTVDVDNGSSNADIRFYTSPDGVAWTQLGSVVNPGSTISFFDSTAVLAVGAHDNGTGNPTTGSVFWAEVYDGIDGTLVERIDATEANANATTWTSSTSGATVTLNKSTSAQYHATVVPPNTTIVQGDGVNDYAQVCGDDTITDFVPATGLTLVLDASFSSGAGSGGVFASSANATTDDGLIVSRNSTNPRVQGRLDDGTTIATIGDNANNVTYSDRFQATFAFGSSDHEAFVDGVSVETATNAVTAETAAGALRFGAEIDGSNPAAFDLYGAAVLGERTSDTEAAAYATEGLTR